MDNFKLRTQTVGAWKKEGFQFSPAADCVGCTRISADFAFSFARAKFYLTAAELFEAFLGNTDAVSPATDGSLILAGNYLLDSDELPLYLLADPIRDELLHAREVHLQALETLAIAQTLVRRTLKQFA
jgi:hypothetical protein